ncbi:MAG: nicotinate (nicotinamide) nucleotide adenylyltransferase [Deltaproteobacteria bacterium]|jgi:nicotinate-nucleotide adenylyltransferase|nr:nicotinate (nicotinamide) nucleotide adenylyltransferase [Deltaproteobacteria bacterium]
MAEKVGLFGGAFDPIHYGHLRAAEELAAHLSLARVIFVPSAQHPHKITNGPVAFRHRLAMLELALAGRPGFEASAVEEALPKPSFTVNTIKALKSLEKGHELFFLVGFDSFRHIQMWRGYRELLSLVPVAVFRRAGAPGGREALGLLLAEVLGSPPFWDQAKKAFLHPKCRAVHHYEGCRLYISSTDLRKRLAAGGSVRYLLPEKVRVYLERRGLYS